MIGSANGQSDAALLRAHVGGDAPNVPSQMAPRISDSPGGMALPSTHRGENCVTKRGGAAETARFRIDDRLPCGEFSGHGSRAGLVRLPRCASPALVARADIRGQRTPPVRGSRPGLGLTGVASAFWSAAAIEASLKQLLRGIPWGWKGWMFSARSGATAAAAQEWIAWFI